MTDSCVARVHTCSLCVLAPYYGVTVVNRYAIRLITYQKVYIRRAILGCWTLSPYVELAEVQLYCNYMVCKARCQMEKCFGWQNICTKTRCSLLLCEPLTPSPYFNCLISQQGEALDSASLKAGYHLRQSGLRSQLRHAASACSPVLGPWPCTAHCCLAWLAPGSAEMHAPLSRENGSPFYMC